MSLVAILLLVIIFIMLGGGYLVGWLIKWGFYITVMSVVFLVIVAF